MASHLVPVTAAQPQQIAQSRTDYERSEIIKSAEQARTAMEEEKGIEIFNKWLAKHPDDANIRYRRGELYRFMEKYPEAIADYKFCTSRAQDKASRGNTFWAIGESYDRMSKTAEADKAYAEAQKALGELTVFQFRLCQRALKAKDGKTALRLANVLLSKGDKDGKLYRAEAYILLNQYDKALADYSALIPAVSKVFKSGGSTSSITYKTSMTLRKALDGRANCYDLLGKPALAEKDRIRRRDMDREVFESTPFMKKE